MNKLKPLAVFIITLILVLPMYSSNALAVNQLTVTKYSGDDNVDGFFKTYDRVNLEVNANIDGDEDLTNTQLTVNGYDFTACSPGAGTSVCTYTSPYYSNSPGTYPLKIDLLSDTGELKRTITKEISIDSIAPKIEFNSNPTQSQQSVSVDYTVKDAAWEPTNYNLCSGIKKIEFYDAAEKLDEITLDETTCTYSDTIILPLPNSERITIKAYDNFDQSSSSDSGDFEMDLNAPSIEENTFKIINKGIELDKFIKGGSYSVDIEVLITEEQLKAENVQISLSSLGGASNLTANSCIKSLSKYLCKWNAVDVSISSTTTANIVITAEDDFGNVISKTISKSFSVDNSAPNVNSIKTEYTSDGSNYIGLNPTKITAEIAESGSGLTQKQIFMDLSSLNPSYGIKQADECVSSGSTWKCVWNEITTTQPHNNIATISLINSNDDVGNQLTGITTTEIKIDKQKPTIIGKANVTASSELVKPDNYFASGDDLVITLKVSDSTKIKAYADLSNIKNDDGFAEVEADCSNVGNEYTCRWNAESIASGYLSTAITLNFYDAAMNQASASVPIIIYGKDTEENPNYWKVSSVDSMPEALDRQTTPIINQRMYFDVRLKNRVGASILKMDLGECSGDTGYLNEDPELFNNVAGSTDPMFMIELKTTTAREDTLKINCTLNIVSLYGDKISNIEEESVPLEVNFYNMPLGEASQELKDKIEEIEKYWIDVEGSVNIGEILGYVKIAAKYSKLICNALGTINEIRAIWDILFGETTTAQVALIIFPPAQLAVTESNRAQCLGNSAYAIGTDSIFQSQNKFCKFVNCQLDPAIASDQTYTSWIGTWNQGVDEYTSKVGGLGLIELDRLGKDPSVYLNSQDSIVGGIMTLCVPGIIYGIDKYRQIQCMYADCLATSINTGVPPDACDKMKSYAECKFVTGELFQLFPLAGFVDHWVGRIKSILSNPMEAAGLILASGCEVACADGTAEFHGFLPYKTCAYIKTVSMLGEVVGDIANIINNEEWLIKDDYCKIAKENIEKIRGTGNSTSSISTFGDDEDSDRTAADEDVVVEDTDEEEEDEE